MNRHSGGFFSFLSDFATYDVVIHGIYTQAMEWGGLFGLIGLAKRKGKGGKGGDSMAIYTQYRLLCSVLRASLPFLSPRFIVIRKKYNNKNNNNNNNDSDDDSDDDDDKELILHRFVFSNRKEGTGRGDGRSPRRRLVMIG